MRINTLRSLVLVGALLAASTAEGQGVRQSLTIHGLEQPVASGSRARAMGGAFTAVADDASALFWNPAGLAAVSKPAFGAGFGFGSTRYAESQRWNPNRYYAGLSLYFQNKESYEFEPLEAPDWTESESAIRMNHASAVLPFSLQGMPAAVAVGYRHVIDLDVFDRNDNVLDPYIGNFRPAPVPRPNPGDSVSVAWSSFERSQAGAIHAVTAGIALEVSPLLRFGLRAERWSGSSDGAQTDAHRGTFSLYDSAHRFSYYPAAATTTWQSTSDYSATAVALGVQVREDRWQLGAEIALPVEVTREWVREGDVTDSGEDVVTLPIAYRFGVALHPSDRLLVSADYTMQDMSDMEADTDDPAGLPAWYSANGIHFGMEWHWRPDLALRAGYRQAPRPYRVVGSGIVDETASGSVYSIGAGWVRGPVMIDAVYEFHRFLLIDRWESNVNHQLTTAHQLLFTVGYRF